MPSSYIFTEEEDAEVRVTIGVKNYEQPRWVRCIIKKVNENGTYNLNIPNGISQGVNPIAVFVPSEHLRPRQN